MEMSNQDLENIDKVEQEAIVQEVMNPIPAGYMTVELSTKGEFGAPKVFHIRNFKTEDLVKLSLEDEDKVQLRVAEMLQDLIYEPKEECDILKFHEKEVIETILRLYKRFYQSKLKNLVWELTDEDKDQIAKEEGGKDTDAYRRRVAAIENGQEKKFFDIDLNKVGFYKVPDDIGAEAVVTNVDPETGKEYSIIYGYPRYGDAIVLRKFLLELPEFKDGEKRYASIRENVKFRNKMEERWRNGENIPLEKIPRFTDKDVEAFNNYEMKKAVFATRAVKALHLVEIDGNNIADLTLDKKLEYADDPRLDHATFEQVNKIYEEMKIGPVEDIEVVDPYLNKVVKIHYTFRLFAILQTLRDNKPDGIGIKFIKRNK